MKEKISENKDFDNILKDLKNDYDRGKTEKNRIRDIMIEENKVLAGEPQGNEKKGKSQIVLKEAAKIINRTMPSLTEPFLSTSRPIKVSRAGSPIRKSIFENYLNMEFTDSMDREELVEEMAKVFLTAPKLWIQPDWIYEEELEEVEYTDGTEETIVTVLENRPDIKVLQTQNVTVDPDATREQDSKFICVEEFSSYSELRQEGGEGKDAIFDDGQMKKLKSWIASENGTNANTSEDEGVFDPNKTTGQASASDTARKRIEIVRYYGYYDMNDNGLLDSIYAVWVKDADIWLTIEKRKFPLGRIPIYGTTFDKIPFSINGNSMIHFLSDNQRIKTGITRGILDNLDEANNGTIFYRPGDVTPESLLQMRLGHKYIAMNNPKAIEHGGFNQIPTAVFNVQNMIDRETQEIAGTTAGSPSVSSAQANKQDSLQMLSLAQEKQLASVRKLGGVLRKAMKHILIEAEEFLEDDQIMELLPPNADPIIFSDTRRVRIGTQVGTATDRANQSHQLNMLMQHSKENNKLMPDHIGKELLAKAFELFDEHSMANAIRGEDKQMSQQEQFAMEQALQEQTLKNRKLMAEIEEIKIRAAASAQRAQNDAQEVQSKIVKNAADANKKNADAQGKRVETSFVPAKELSGLESINNRQIGRTETNE
jgi:hypothetical protein